MPLVMTVIGYSPTLSAKMSALLLLTLRAFSFLHGCQASTTTSIGATTRTGGNIRLMPLIPHRVQRQRRLAELGLSESSSELPDEFRRRTEAQQVGALYHGYGTHYADVWIGTPPQRQTVIVDTGSGSTAFPCSGCKDCGAPTYHIDNYFVEADSVTFQKTPCGDCQRGTCSSDSKDAQCKFSMSYQEGSSWYAYEAQDVTYVGGPHNVALMGLGAETHTDDIDPDHAIDLSFLMTFGCQYKVTGLFKTQLADGIMGMENAKTSFWKQLYNAGNISQQLFSLCFSRPPSASKEGTLAGTMTFGGVESRMHDTPMIFTDKASGSGSGFFSVSVRAIHLRKGGGGDSALSTDPNIKTIQLDVAMASLNLGGVIVDSGTTDTYWNKKISQAFRTAFSELTGGKAYSHSGLALSEDEMNALPTILIQLVGDADLNGELATSLADGDANQVVGLAGDLDPNHPFDVVVAIPPLHYMEKDSSGKYTARFYDDERSGSVLGANAMMGHDILFDAENVQIGWAESQCDYHKLVTDSGFTDVLEETGSSSGSSGGGDTAPAGGDVPAQDNTDEKTTKEEKKDHPTSSDITHDDSSPADDIQKSSDGLVDACNTKACRGGVAFTVFAVLLLGCWCVRLYYGKRSSRGYKRPRAKEQHRADVELSSKYRDEGGYADDAEYGEFETKGRIS